MAQRIAITCINKSNRYDPHERILNVGGAGWKISEAEAIRRIKSGAASYYVHRGGLTVDVIIATRLGKEYLKTKEDQERPDNLLSLPECLP
jgi:hypothetical protein